MKSAHFIVNLPRASWHDTRQVTVCLLPRSLVFGEHCLYTRTSGPRNKSLIDVLNLVYARISFCRLTRGHVICTGVLPTTPDLYCTFGCGKITDVGTFSFRRILPFWYFCLKTGYKARLALYPVCNQKYQKWIIHRKLKVPTSEREGKLSNPRGRAARPRCMNFSPENLRDPAQGRCEGAMRLFCRGQKYSS
jgi:hypothetical protein